MIRPVIQAHIVDRGPLTDVQIAEIVALQARMLAGVLRESGATLGTPAVSLDGLPHDAIRAAISAPVRS